ncbi:MAG: signal peptidase II [Magnetococcales bacterium]|nr:signal peptidase II [Magnetococcales bacterium]
MGRCWEGGEPPPQPPPPFFFNRLAGGWGGTSPPLGSGGACYAQPCLLPFGLWTTLVVLLIDQLSKWYASQHLADQSITLVPGFFDLELVHNMGAAFGLFANFAPGWRSLILIGVAVVATVFILTLLRKSDRILEALALGLVLGGALGNLLDRVRNGWVVDFLHLHWHDLSWPVFNLADSAICVGVGLLLWDSFRKTGTKQ